jgi:hypothetical protein
MLFSGDRTFSIYFLGRVGKFLPVSGKKRSSKKYFSPGGKNSFCPVEKNVYDKCNPTFFISNYGYSPTSFKS